MIQRPVASDEMRLTPLTAGARIGSGWVKPAALAVLACAMAGVSLSAARGAPGWFGAALALLMLAIAVIDARSLLIPNRLSLAAFLLALAAAANDASRDVWPEFWRGHWQELWLPAAQAVGLSMIRAAVLGLAFLALRALYFRLRGCEGIGLGDVKLAAVAGAWLDWPLMPVAVEIAALAGLCVYGLGLLAGRRPFNAAARLPFGLFFAPAIWFCWLIQTGFFEF
jgi:leader peptidase (prepilin peptidase)/N-methyltransferase